MVGPYGVDSQRQAVAKYSPLLAIPLTDGSLQQKLATTKAHGARKTPIAIRSMNISPTKPVPICRTALIGVACAWTFCPPHHPVNPGQIDPAVSRAAVGHDVTRPDRDRRNDPKRTSPPIPANQTEYR